MLFSRVRFFMPIVFSAGMLAGCSGAGHSLPPAASTPSSLSALAAPPRLNQAVPRRPAFIDSVPKLPASLAASRTPSTLATHPSFFAGETPLSNGVYYLQLPNGNLFGYYSYLADPRFIYHFDLGYEFVIDANDGAGGLYLYDFASGHWWYTSRQYPFPYLYDFTLNAILYYYADSKNPQHYSTAPRYFYNFGTSQIVTVPSALQAPAVGYLSPASAGSMAGILNNVTSSVTFVGISGAQVPNNSGTPVETASVSVGFGPTVLSSKRAPRSVAASPKGPAMTDELPVEGPQEYNALIRGLRPAAGVAPSSVRRTRSLGTAVGATNQFWVSVAPIGGGGGSAQAQRAGTLKVVTPHGYIWIDDSLSTLSSAAVQTIANDFENAYVSDTTHFGTATYSASSPGILGHAYTTCDANGTPTGGSVPVFITPTDNKVVVFVVDVNGLGRGVGGYFSSVDFLYQAALNCLIGQGYTSDTLPHSNEAPMIFVGYNTKNDEAHETGEDLVRGTSHEFQHQINFVNHLILNKGGYEDRWINEGMSMLAQDFAVNKLFPSVAIDVGDAARRLDQFLQAPETFSLTGFTQLNPASLSQQYNCSGCYGEEYLFQRYLYDRFGGDAYLHKMLGAQYSLANVQQATATDPIQTIGDFAIAIAASNTGATSDPRFNFTGINLRAGSSYADQFGQTYFSLNGPAALPLGSQTQSYPLGSFFYLAGDPTASGKTVSASDASGAFKLRAGVVQR